MSYLDRERSPQSGEPVDFFEFRLGLTFWRFTSSATPVQIGNDVFSPSSIQRGAVGVSGDVFKDALQITLPRGNAFASHYLNYPVDEVATVTLWRGHVGEDQRIVAYKGRIVSATATDGAVTINCESVYTAIRRPGLRARYELNCRHPLYGRGCKVSSAAYTVHATVQEISRGVVLMIPLAGEKPDGHYKGGMLSLTGGAARMIVGHAGETITINRPIRELNRGGRVFISAGCDKLLTTCRDKFDNVDNFGGFPWIPRQNPFDGPVY